MMKKTLIGATFVAAFAGAVGVSATTVNMRGSDTLFDLTNAVIAVCPGTTGPYAGTGSGNGQNAMTAAGATQFVAPMSRFLNNGACTAPAGGTAAGPQTDGLVIGLDGVAVVGSKTTFTSVACNGDPNLTCDPGFEPTTGGAYNTAVAGYTFTGWRDVLRVLLAGLDHSAAASGTGAAAWAARDCNSATRLAIANSYGALFENNCTAPAGDVLGTCAQIRHIFRRDDMSGTTDTMVGLLGLPAIVLPETNVTLNTTGTPATIVNHTGASPFCNSVRPAFVFPQSGTTTLQPICLQGADATWDPTTSTTVPACAGGAATPHEVGVFRATMQDNDPIRRSCNANEQVCAHSKDLGLVLVMNDVPEPAPRTNADRYNVAACAAGRFASASPPEVYNAITQQRIIRTTGLLCPNGDIVNNLNSCLVPSTAAGNTQCLAIVTNAPAVTISSVPVPVAHPQAPGIAEGRAYNTQLYVQVGAAGAYQTNGYSTPLPITGAYFRIHSTRSMNTVSRTCQQADMTDQIGCLVEASPCSIGYAGRGSIRPDINPNTDAIKMNKQSPEDLCITGSSTVAGFTYPLSRKLYLSSIVGFANISNSTAAPVPNEDLHLAGCETDLDQAGLSPATTAAGVGFRTVFDAAGFIPLPTTVNGGRPYCEDFNENMLCAAASNNNGCTTAPSNGLNFPAFSTTCGNGIREPYEDCDCGTAATPASADAANVALCAGTLNGGTVCTTVCRTIN